MKIQVKTKLQEIHEMQKKDEKIVKNLLENIKKLNIENADSFIGFVGPLERILQGYSVITQNIRREISEGWLRGSLHLAESVFLGKSRDSFKKFLMNSSGKGFQASSNGIEIKDTTPADIGVLLSYRQHCAAFAVQKLISENLTETTNSENCSPGYIEYMLTKADYLRAYGLEPQKNAKSKRFSSYDRKDAFEALIELSKIEVWIDYERGPDKKGLREKVSYLRRLVNLGRPQRNKKKLLLEINKVFLDELTTYFYLLPRNYLSVVRNSGASKYHAQFFVWLFVQQSHKIINNEPPKTTASTKNLAERLRMEIFIKARQWTKIRKIIAESAEIAKANLWLMSHEYCREKDQHLFTWENNNGK